MDLHELYQHVEEMKEDFSSTHTHLHPPAKAVLDDTLLPIDLLEIGRRLYKVMRSEELITMDLDEVPQEHRNRALIELALSQMTIWFFERIYEAGSREAADITFSEVESLHSCMHIRNVVTKLAEITGEHPLDLVFAKIFRDRMREDL